MGAVPIELRLLSTGSIAEGATDTVRVKLEWASLENEIFELVDLRGDVVSTLSLSEESRRVYSGEHTFNDPGHYRVRVRGDLGTQIVERETEFCLNVRQAPSIEVVSPAPGENYEEGFYFTIEWSDSCPERSATITLGYDDDLIYDGSESVIATEDEDGPQDSYEWSVFWVPEGTWNVWASIDDGVNDPVISYGGSVTVTKGYQDGWPIQVGARIEAPVCVYDLDGNGTTRSRCGRS